jgi:uncharacterized protein
METETLTKPVPIPDHDTRPFWEGCQFRWPPQPFCPSCYSWEQEWVKLSGRGTVMSFSVVHHSAVPSFKESLPYVVAVIELEGTDRHVALTSNVIDCPWEDVKVGMPVEVVFEDLSPEATIHQFRPQP